MTVMDLDCDLDAPRAPRAAPAPVAAPAAPTARATNLAVPETQWGWAEFRDYVMREIERRHGPQVRNAVKEAGIFKGFISRWGIERSVAIARLAFDFYDGMWRGAPISVSRFAAGNDPYFAAPIAEHLSTAA